MYRMMSEEGYDSIIALTMFQKYEQGKEKVAHIFANIMQRATGGRRVDGTGTTASRIVSYQEVN